MTRRKVKVFEDKTWLDLQLSQEKEHGLGVAQMLVSIGIVVWAARTNRPAAIIVAVALSQPVVWAGVISMLLAGFRLAGWVPRWPWEPWP